MFPSSDVLRLTMRSLRKTKGIVVRVTELTVNRVETMTFVKVGSSKFLEPVWEELKGTIM